MDSPKTNRDAPDPSGETARIAARARTGAPEEFERLYARVAPMLLAWARIRIPAELKRQFDADDVLKETWFRAVSRIDTFDPRRRNFRAWILGIARNVLLEGYRKHADAVQRLGATNYARSDTNRLDELPESITSVRSRLASDEAHERFFAYVDELELVDRRVLLFCGFEGYTCAQAATRLSLSPEATTKRWQQLRATLRDSAVAQTLDLRGLE